MKNHLIKLFQYNQWRHELIYQFLCEIPKLQEFIFSNFQCLFFNQPAGTLDHLIIADEIWKMRLTNQTDTSEYKQLMSYWAPQNRFKFSEHWKQQFWLKHYREDTYRTINNFIEIINQYPSENDLEKKILFPDSQGNKKERIIQDVFTHLINHHTHHIGQVSAAYKQYAKSDNFPSLDYTYFLN